MTNTERPATAPISAPVDSGAIGRLNEAERADFLANLRQNLGYRAWVIEDTMLGHVERIVREHTDRALAEVEQRIEALHVRHEGPVVEHGCVEGDCEHITDDEYDGPYPAPECPVLADAVCAYCADQTDPSDGWEHMIRPAAYWPCATIRHLRAARQEQGR